MAGPSLSRIVLIAELDFVAAAARRPFHNLGDGRLAILRQAVDAASHEEFGAELFSQAIELVNVAFSISDMYTSPRLSGQFGRPAQMVVSHVVV